MKLLVIVSLCCLLRARAVEPRPLDRSQRTGSLAVDRLRGIHDKIGKGLASSISNHVDKPLDKNLQDATKVFDKATHANFFDILAKDLEKLVKAFTAGWRTSLEVVVENSVLVVVGVVWLLVFRMFVYQDDRAQSQSTQGANSASPSAVGAPDGPGSMEPDMVLVFHHPNHKDGDEETKVDFSLLSRTLVSYIQSWQVAAPGGASIYKERSLESKVVTTRAQHKVLHGYEDDGWVKLERGLGHVPLRRPEPESEAVVEPVLKGHDQFSNMRACIQESLTVERSRSLKDRLTLGKKHLPPKQDARVALLKDLYEVCPAWGFDVSIFSSIDDDELYLCLSLTDEDAIETYLNRTETLLQLRQDMAERLGIGQPPDEPASDPVSVRYDPWLVQKLHEGGVLSSNDPCELYQSRHGRNWARRIALGGPRFRMMAGQMAGHLNLDAAKEDGMIVDWYPAHCENWLDLLKSCWAGLHHVTDLSFKQPVALLHQYLGARVAFTCAWTGLYCKALLALTAYVALYELVASVTPFVEGLLFGAGEGGALHRDAVLTRTMVAFSIVMQAWARWASNLWAREHQFFVEMWNLQGDANLQVMRPSFQGTLKPSEVDSNRLEKHYPELSARLKGAAAGLFTLCFCAVVAGLIVVWATIFGDNMNTMASLWLTVQIKVCELVYNMIVPALVEWENHRYEASYFDSIVLKQFAFQSVNNYLPFVYLMVSGIFTMPLLRHQLSVTLMVLSVARIAEVFLEWLVVKFKIWWEDYNLKKRRGTEPLPKRWYVEEQAKFHEVDLPTQVQDMIQLVISLGFILLFGCAAPLSVPFCLAVFAVHLRGSAYMLVNFSKRPVPKISLGIGLWSSIIGFLMHLSLFFCGFLIAQYCEIFKDVPFSAKAVVLIILFVVYQLVWFLVDQTCPPHSADAEVMRARRECVKRRLADKAEEKSQSSLAAGCDRNSSKVSPLSAEVKAGNWSNIPHLEESGLLRCTTLGP